MKLLKAFLIFFIVFGIMYFFTGFSYADFNYANWKESSRNGIISMSFFSIFFYLHQSFSFFSPKYGTARFLLISSSAIFNPPT